jgi:alkylation response protein AidB-like acyl-CoA dehydrogenase
VAKEHKLTETASMIKYSSAVQVADECLQLFGGYGYVGLSISRM